MIITFLFFLIWKVAHTFWEGVLLWQSCVWLPAWMDLFHIQLDASFSKRDHFYKMSNNEFKSEGSLSKQLQLSKAEQCEGQRTAAAHGQTLMSCLYDLTCICCRNTDKIVMSRPRNPIWSPKYVCIVCLIYVTFVFHQQKTFFPPFLFILISIFHSWATRSRLRTLKLTFSFMWYILSLQSFYPFI